MGYANVDGNDTGFFEFPEHTEENLALHNKFRTDSQAALAAICSPNKGPKKNYTHNVEEVFDLFDPEDLEKLLDPAFDFARKTIT